jgi:hypothetical protein
MTTPMYGEGAGASRTEGGAMRDCRVDFEHDFEQFATILGWTDAISLALTIPLLLVLYWWFLR